MRKMFDLHADTMALTLVLWLCSLPLIALLVLPLFGPAAPLGAALALLVGFLVLCWGLCLQRGAGQIREKRTGQQVSRQVE